MYTFQRKIWPLSSGSKCKLRHLQASRAQRSRLCNLWRTQQSGQLCLCCRHTETNLSLCSEQKRKSFPSAGNRTSIHEYMSPCRFVHCTLWQLTGGEISFVLLSPPATVHRALGRNVVTYCIPIVRSVYEVKKQADTDYLANIELILKSVITISCSTLKMDIECSSETLVQ